MKTKCYSVRVESLAEISPKAFRLTAYDGSSCIIPKSAVLAEDFEVEKSQAYYIAAWCMDTRSVQFSKKKVRWFENGKMLADTIVTHHVPEKVDAVADNRIEDLSR